MKRILPLVVLVGVIASVALPGRAADVFDFIPPGGRSLLATILGTGAPADEVRGIVAGNRSEAEWRTYLGERRGRLPGVARLTDKELATLTSYLTFNMPLPAARVPGDPARANWDKILPADGRDLALDNCQSCHIITVVITQDRSKAAWLGTMNKPSHVQIKLSREQREALADYLVQNAGIPIDRVPEELRAGGATY